jgi:hypothetical protein
MKQAICPLCGAKMKRNGFTSKGTQRWRCKGCGSSSVHKHNNDAKELQKFLDWLLSRDKQIDMAGQGRTFRRKIARFWSIWPMPSVVDEVHRVIYVDGIYLSRNVVVLIACSDSHVLSWYLARSENSHAWTALLANIAPPDMVVTDGGSGLAKALKKTWPHTKVQRCTFHAFCQVRRCTTTRPRLLAGKELYMLAKELLHAKTLRQADLWVEHFMQWCEFWADFLAQTSFVEGKKVYTHERMRQARRALVTLINQGTLFTYLDPELSAEGSMPAMNNRIEGGINAQLRALLRDHRGMSTMRRIKAVYWWCYMHTECPLSASEILKSMPTDEDIDFLYDQYAPVPNKGNKPVEWGDGLVWRELHHSTPYPYSAD